MQSIALNGTNSSYASSDGICYQCIKLGVGVYETPDLAREVVKSRIKYQPQYYPPYPYNGLKDPRAEYSTDDGGLIQYKNIIGGIISHGDEIAPYAPLLAKIWLDRIAHAKSAPEKSDLHLQPDRIYLSSPYLTSPANSDFLPREPAADKQAVAVKVENRGTVVAKNVKLQLYKVLDDKNEPLGSPVSVGDISPGQVKNASAFWDLRGKNVEGAVLQARAYIPGEKDANELDNNASVNVNIYYAYNGNRAYSWSNDSYRLANYGFNDRETEEIVEGLLSTVVGNMNADDLPQVLQRLFFPSTYKRFQNYAEVSTELGAGGHCYGMSATSALYFEDKSLKPLPKSVPDMTLEEASTNINIYHRAQMLPLWKSILGDKLAFQREESPAKCRQAVMDSLKNSRQPVIIEFFGDLGGHAVLAYKLIEVEGRDPVVYVYDSNSPEPNAKPPRPITQITLQTSLDYWRYPTYMGYSWAYPHNISAHKVFREIPLQEVNDLVPSLKKAVYEMMETMKKANAFMAVLKCPADAVFTDDQGRRVGVVDGQAINEIPGAEVLSDGEVEIYQLPAEEEYALTITATGEGMVSFDVIRTENGSAGLTSFQDIPVQSGTQITGTLQPQGMIESLQSGSETITPTLQNSIDVTGFGAESPEVIPNNNEKPTDEDLANEELILEIDSSAAVQNAPTEAASFSIDRPTGISKIRTYHWNEGLGQAPGTIGLMDQEGIIFGPWQASGEKGSGVVADSFWVVLPNIDLKNGEYTVIDSDPATWSQNSETGGRGMTSVWGSSKMIEASSTCSWSGTWNTSWGEMMLQESGNTVTGSYPHDQGQIQARSFRSRLVGTWSEAPTRSAPDDAGEFEFSMAENCSSFSGNWRYGETGDWSGSWTGTRA